MCTTDKNGRYDKSFGINGFVTFDNFWVSSNRELFVYDNKVYLVGNYYEKERRIAVFRLNRDGSIDKTFGIDGKVIFDFINDGSPRAYFDGNGNIYIVGTIFNGKDDDVVIIKIDKDGKVDKSFGVDGKVIFDKVGKKGNFDLGGSIFGDNNGDIYIAGHAGSMDKDGNVKGEAFIIKMDKNGEVDRSFGSSGKIFINIKGFDKVRINSIFVKDEKVYIVGQGLRKKNDSYISSGVVCRINKDGSFDQSFGNKGIFKLNYGNDDTSFYDIIEDRNDLLLVGNVLENSKSKLFIVKVQ